MSSETEEELSYSEVYYLPELFGVDKAGKERIWKVWTEGNKMHRISGLISGKKVSAERTFVGKNIGKKNETSAEEQAKIETEKQWIKQVDKGYEPKCKEGKAMLKKINAEKKKTGGTNVNVTNVMGNRTKKNIKEVDNHRVKNLEMEITPMKAATWELKDTENPISVLPKVIKYFNFDEGVYLEPKYDGYRCVARLQDDGEVSMTSNNRKQFPHFGKHRKELARLMKNKDFLDGIDCELYAHRITDSNGIGLNDVDRFSTIQSICGVSRSTPHEYEDQICCYVFDLVDTTGKYDQDERFERLKKLFKGFKSDVVILSEIQIAYMTEEVNDWHDKFALEGYEGIIIRDRSLRYEVGKRSLKMRKFKYFIDAEYTVVDVQVDKGVDKSQFVWVCENKEKKRFNVKPLGTQENKWYWYDNHTNYLGKKLTVKFQNITPDGIPRFPVGKGFRDEGDI